tara:strand:+ start:92 stop:391 length:300 start_codon:yes stop_codon:yes gene_type:complete
MTQTEDIMEDVIVQISVQIIPIEIVDLNGKKTLTEGTTRRNHVILINDLIAAINLNRTLIIIISDEIDEEIINLTNAEIRDDYYSDMTALDKVSYLAFR